jgi:AcrR family transcriptional regulator
MSRVETAAATRRALLAEAAALLESGGPAAVTLREVGARAGVSRGAPYGHFTDKEALLTAVAAQGWERLGDEMQRLKDDSALAPREALRRTLLSVITLSRRSPHLYQLMFTRPVGDPEAVVRAAQRMCDHFLGIVSAVVGDEEASRHAAILLTGAHGAAGVETSGLLDTDKWRTTAEELIDILLATIAKPSRRR